MRGFILVLLAGLSLAMTGCTAITKELRYPGGYPGYELDKRTFDASRSKQLQLLRGAIVLAMAARIGEANVSAEEAEPFAQHLAVAAKEVNFAAGNLPFPGNPVCLVKPGQGAAIADADCNGYPVNFEADISRVESRIVRAMIAALPTDRVKGFLEDLSRGDALSATFGAAQALGDAAGSFHRAAGAHRSGLEIVALQRGECGVTDARITVIVALGCLGVPPDELFFNNLKGTTAPFAGEVDPAAFHAVMRIVRTACVGLPLTNELQTPDLLKIRATRRETCKAIAFAPVKRPEQVPPDDDQGAVPVGP